jgi:hypothetical protein
MEFRANYAYLGIRPDNHPPRVRRGSEDTSGHKRGERQRRALDGKLAT